MSIIKVENLVKYYGDFQAVKEISFNLEKNEALGLLGLNGAGKTTVLRILSGFLIPSSGKINISGYDIHENPLEIKKQLGYLPESPPLYNELSVSEYLIFVAGIKGVEKEDIPAKLKRAIDKSGLESVENRLINELSLGFRKRVGIAQAIIHDPEIVILDEPISGLDPKQIVEMRNLINELKKDHSLIISSHILSEVSKTCDRFLLIHDGEIIRQETSTSLLQRVNQMGTFQITLKCRDDQIASIQDFLENQIGAINVSVHRELETQRLNFNVQKEFKWKKELVDFLISSDIDFTSFNQVNSDLESIFLELQK